MQVGNEFATGQCRKACKACKACNRGDWECINKNRIAAGYLPLDKKEMQWLGLADFFNK